MKIGAVFSKIFSFIPKFYALISYKDKESMDHLEAYPERLHVRALPERRYLKASRVLVIFALVSLSLNILLAILFMHNASHVSATITRPDGSSHLYTLDMFQRKMRQVEGPRRWWGMEDLVLQNMITEYLTLRYTILPNESEMEKRWRPGGKLFLYAQKLYEGWLPERSNGVLLLRSGYIQEIYIYSIQYVFSNLYRVYFDLFRLPYQRGEVVACNCLNKTKECLDCLREKAKSTQRMMVYMRVDFDAEMSTRENIIENPLRFNVQTFTAYPQGIRKGDPWTDVDLIKD